MAEQTFSLVSITPGTVTRSGPPFTTVVALFEQSAADGGGTTGVSITPGTVTRSGPPFTTVVALSSSRPRTEEALQVRTGVEHSAKMLHVISVRGKPISIR